MEIVKKLHNDEEARILLGGHDEHIKLIERELSVTVLVRGATLSVTGNKRSLSRAEKLIDELLDVVRTSGHLKKQEVLNALHALHHDAVERADDIQADRIDIMSKRQFVIPKTPGQKKYIAAIRSADITFGIGPAGTGKTYMAMAMAVAALKRRDVSRIILTRPAVEAGESLGYLPGDLSEKITPYLRPLYDALYDMMDTDKVRQSIERGIIEVAPLAYMRGRTLNDCFIVLDEAQNSTPEQMKMFLTRLGFDAKAVITGDITQVDLPAHRKSGLIEVQAVLRAVDGIKFIYLDERDVVRHRLVQDIIRAYAHYETTTDRTGHEKKRQG